MQRGQRRWDSKEIRFQLNQWVVFLSCSSLHKFKLFCCNLLFHLPSWERGAFALHCHGSLHRYWDKCVHACFCGVKIKIISKLLSLIIPRNCQIGMQIFQIPPQELPNYHITSHNNLTAAKPLLQGTVPLPGTSGNGSTSVCG